MPTEIMPRPDLRTDWHDEPGPETTTPHRHRRPGRLAWVVEELRSRPRLLGAILALGVLAFAGGALYRPTAPVAGPTVVDRRPTVKPSTSAPAVTATPAPSEEPTAAPIQPSRVPVGPNAPRRTPFDKATTHRPAPTSSRTRVESPAPSDTAHTPPPVDTTKPKPPETGGPLELHP